MLNVDIKVIYNIIRKTQTQHQCDFFRNQTLGFNPACGLKPSVWFEKVTLCLGLTLKLKYIPNINVHIQRKCLLPPGRSIIIINFISLAIR